MVQDAELYNNDAHLEINTSFWEMYNQHILNASGQYFDIWHLLGM